jgi:hypothetical protein
MGLKQIVNSPRSKIVIALLLGFGLSTFFRKTCEDKNCIEFKAPPLDKVNGQTFEYNTKCYRFESKQQDCNEKKKRVVTFA